jgi:hypothetical protein
LQIDTEDSLLESLIGLGCDYYEFWSYIEVNLLTKEGLSLFVSTLPFDELRLDIWSKVINCLTGISDSNHPRRNHRHRNPSSNLIASLPFKSVILNEIPSVLNEFEGKQWQLLYRGTADGFSSSAFHNKCNDQSNTVTIIETTNGFIFGGFTPIAWDSNNSSKADSTHRSFLFTLKNPHNIAARKFALSNSSYAIYCPSSYGPIFGNSHDIYVANDCNATNSGDTHIGNGYANDTGINGVQVFTGEQYFTAKEVEVFTICG